MKKYGYTFLASIACLLLIIPGEVAGLAVMLIIKLIFSGIFMFAENIFPIVPSGSWYQKLILNVFAPGVGGWLAGFLVANCTYLIFNNKPNYKFVVIFVLSIILPFSFISSFEMFKEGIFTIYSWEWLINSIFVSLVLICWGFKIQDYNIVGDDKD